MNKTSACLSALLTASLIPLSGSAATGTLNYPVSAQKAFQTVVTGLDASGWPAAAAATSVSQPMPTMTMSTPPKADQLSTEEWIARLVKLTRSFTDIGSVDKDTCRVLKLCDGTAKLPMKLAQSEIATDGGEHYFGVPLNEDSKDLIILRKTDGVVESFLIDKTGKLRTAAINTTSSGARIITNEKAAEQFKKELALFAAEASGLPPTGAAVAGK